MTNICFINQASIVIRALMDGFGYSRSEAIEIWVKSKTRKEIQEHYKFEHISGARCYDELMMELNHDPYWMHGAFD